MHKHNGGQLVTRFAPSPTGFLHAGNYRTAVFAYLYARHKKGTFSVRIEDTDKARSEKKYEKQILESLEWLGLEYDALHRQSEWVREHERILKDFIDRNVAYISKEKNDEGVERELVRFRNPGKDITFDDLVRGSITVNTRELGDFIIAKSMTEPVFHLANVADDALQGVTHIIRGEDHISNTPRQMLIYEALDAHVPHYAHLPLVLASDKSKLSKRKGARPLLEYRDLGYEPSAVLNYLALLGWHPSNDEEFFTKDELIERFTFDQVHKSGAVYDEVKLRWFNREHLLRLPESEFEKRITKSFSNDFVTKAKERDVFNALLPIIKERIETFGDVEEMEKSGEWSYFIEDPDYTSDALTWKEEGVEMAKKHLEKIHKLISALDESEWKEVSIKNVLWEYATDAGRGSVLWPFRYALTGREKSPDPFVVAAILGKDETLKRVAGAVEKCA